MKMNVATLVLFDIGIYVSFALRCSSFLASFLYISLDVKVGEEDKEECSMEQNDIAEYLWEVTFKEQRETGMDEEGHELDHLQRCKISEIEWTQALVKADYKGIRVASWVDTLWSWKDHIL